MFLFLLEFFFFFIFNPLSLFIKILLLFLQFLLQLKSFVFFNQQLFEFKSAGSDVILKIGFKMEIPCNFPDRRPWFEDCLAQSVVLVMKSLDHLLFLCTVSDWSLSSRIFEHDGVVSGELSLPSWFNKLSVDESFSFFDKSIGKLIDLADIVIESQLSDRIRHVWSFEVLELSEVWMKLTSFQGFELIWRGSSWLLGC